VTGDDMVAAMDAVGVDGALLVSPFAMYRYDASYAVDVHAAHPGRFGLIKPVDPADPGVADTIAAWAATSGAVGVRIMMREGVSTDAADPGLNRVLAAAARHKLPVNLLCWGRLEQAGLLAGRNPETSVVIDHLGLQQPFEPPAPAAPFADLPRLLALASHDNIAVKITGACTLSHEPFPFRDFCGGSTTGRRQRGEQRFGRPVAAGVQQRARPATRNARPKARCRRSRMDGCRTPGWVTAAGGGSS
jgi:predicted TIM-barrel fold metal-dependent hydrolase